MDQFIRLLRAAADPSRIRLLALCARGEFTVSELVQVLGQSQPRVSRHLKVLCDAGFLERLSEGNWAYYRQASGSEPRQAVKQLLSLLPADDEIIARDQLRLAEVKAVRCRSANEYLQGVASEWDHIHSLHRSDGSVEKAILAALAPPPGGSVAGTGGRLIDIGTGTGRMLEILGPRTAEAIGIDKSYKMLTIARAKLDRAGLNNCRVRYGDMYAMPFDAASFDAAVIHQVLHYAEDPGAVLAEATRVLRPGGRLVVTDFACHDHQELRDKYHHQHLGFDQAAITGWFLNARLVGLPPVRLTGGALTVMVWPAVKEEEISRHG